MKNRKHTILKSNATFNGQAQAVKDPLFLEHDFFDAHDLLQVKYEMIRKVEYENCSVAKAARLFGFSRPSFYSTRASYKSNGLVGLAPQKRGPKKPHKISTEMAEFILKMINDEPGISHKELTKRIQNKFEIEIHPRTIERTIHQLKKKL